MMQPSPQQALTKRDIVNYLWSQGDLSYRLWDQQKRIYDALKSLPSTSQTVVFLCARQFGKSVLGSILYTEDCLQNPNCMVLVVGPTIKQTREIVNPRMRMLVNDAPPGTMEFIKSEDRYIIGDSELLLGGFDIKNSSRQRGKTLLKIYIEEIVDSDPDQYLDFIRSDLAPALTHSPNAQIVYLTTPPKIPDHPFLTETVPEARLGGAYYCYTIDDNKALSPEQKQKIIKLCGGERSVEARRELWCEIVRDPSVVVVPEFSDDRHVKDFPVPHQRHMQVTADWGGVRDLTVALLHTYDFYNDKLLILGERWWPSNTSTTRIIEDWKPWFDDYKIESIHADVPGQLQVDLAESHDVDVQLPPKDDWRAAVNQMAICFTFDQILIHPSCRLLIESLRSGMLNTTKTDFARTKSLGHCDALAALMYAVRVQNRINPFQVYQATPFGQTTFGINSDRHPPDHVSQLIQAIKPKSFGKFK